MSGASFNQLRLELDAAITYQGEAAARHLAEAGFDKARREKLEGEMFYFAAQLAMLDEDYETAKTCLWSALDVNPDDGAAYNDLALCAVEYGRMDQALDFFDRGIAVEPDFATIHHNKGWLLNQLGRHSDAIESLQKALQLQPHRAVTYENLADAHAQLGRIVQAITLCQKAREVLDPSCADIHHQLSARMNDFLDRLSSRAR